MSTTRRSIIAMAGMAPLMSLAREDGPGVALASADDSLVLTDFTRDEPFVIRGAGWRGFTDRVMGGVSNADFERIEVAGRRAMRMTGDVTRDNGGGFVQMAMYFDGASDASEYRGIELQVYGNDEDYNVHVRTADCGWHNQSYRATIHAKPEWQTVQLPWDAFEPNDLNVPLDPSTIRRVALLGWMRDFEADVALARISLWGQRNGVLI